VEFRVLGPLEVVHDGVPVALGGPRERAVLRALLLRANEIASIGYLVDAVWEEPPARPESNLRTYVAALRRRLDESRLLTRPGGYLLAAGRDELDLVRFEELVSAAESALASGDEAAAAGDFRQALDLWRGDPLEIERPGPALQAELARLQERWFSAVRQYCDTRFTLGQHVDVVDELRRLVTRYPLREELWALLLTALCGAGRRAEALDAFDTARKRLVEELGVEPGSRLQDLYAAMLRDDVDRARPVPAQLPADLSVFTGREAELTRLVEPLRGDAPAAVVINAIDGMAGIGKSALAVHAAHRLAADYPDGQLFVALHGNTPGVAPVTPDAALHQLLRGLAVPEKEVPEDLDAAAAMYRSRVAGQRLLVLLDDAANERQVRPLLPGAPGCFVLVTSRRRLTALDGAVPLTLDVLPRPDAVALFTRVAAVSPGAGPVVHEIVGLCGHLPLAIRIAAARLRARPGWPLTHLADRLRDQRRRLGELAAGELSVAAAFHLSHQHLTDAQQRMFRMLGLHPGADFDTGAAAALADIGVEQTQSLLEDLVDVHLLQAPEPGRYRFHDLVRQHAAEQVESRAEAEQALRRLVDHYVHTASTGQRLLDPNRRRPELDQPTPGSRPDPLTDLTEALDWFGREHAALLAVQRRAAELGWHRDVWLVAWTLDTFHYRRGHAHDQIAAWRLGLAAAEHAGDVPGQCHAHRLIGSSDARIARYTEAKHHLDHALALAEGTRDTYNQAHTHWALVTFWTLQGDDQQALVHCEHALRLFTEIDHPVWAAHARNGVGWFHARLGDLDEARGHLVAALAQFRAHGEVQGEAATLSSLGFVHHRSGAHTEALDHYRQAIALLRETGNTYTEANLLDQLGDIHEALGDHASAHAAWRHALVLYEKHDRTAEAHRARQRLAR
jgi:DNA-binding SARP family transcriptional activator